MLLKKNINQVESVVHQQIRPNTPQIHITQSTQFDIKKFFLNMSKEDLSKLQNNESRIKKTYEENGLENFICSPFEGLCAGSVYAIIKQLMLKPNSDPKQLTRFLNSQEGKLYAFMFQTFLGAAPISRPSLTDAFLIDEMFNRDLEAEKIVQIQVETTTGISPDQVHYYIQNKKNVYPSTLNDSSIYALAKHFDGKYLAIGLEDINGNGHSIFLYSSDEMNKHYFYDSQTAFFSCCSKEILTKAILTNFNITKSTQLKIKHITAITPLSGRNLCQKNKKIFT